MSETTDRRQSPRMAPDGLAFFKIEPDEGGTVADVSEGGVGFHLISPVSVSDVRPVKFSFSFDSQNLIYGFGELAWLDESRKSGGLRFLRVPEEIIGKLRSSSGVFSLYPNYEAPRTETTATREIPAEIEMAAVQTLVQHDPQQAAQEDIPAPQPAAVSTAMSSRQAANVEAKSAPVPAEVRVGQSSEAAEVEDPLEVYVTDKAVISKAREQVRAKESVDQKPSRSPAGFAAGIRPRIEREPSYDRQFGPLPSEFVKVPASAPSVPVPVPASDYYGHPPKDPALVPMTHEQLFSEADATQYSSADHFAVDRPAQQTAEQWRDPFTFSDNRNGKESDYPSLGRPVFTEPKKPMFSPALIRGLILALIIGTMLAGAALALISYRQEAGAWLVEMGERLSGSRSNAAVNDGSDQTGNITDANTPNASATDVPTANTNQSALKAQTGAAGATPLTPPAAKAPSIPVRPAANNPAQVTSAAPQPQSARLMPAQPNAAPEADAPSADYGDADVTAAEKMLHGANGASDPTGAARVFWGAVEKGNTTAEIALADLYARGQGVPKSCDQARVLLTAAVSKGSSVASSKLLELNAGGCSQ